MKIIGVIDLKEGAVVRAVAGQRENYRPIQSFLTSSTDPRDIAQAMRDQLGIDEIYLADLDAIEGAEPADAVVGRLLGLGFKLWWDPGVRDEVHARRLRRSTPVDRLVVGLESLRSLEELTGIRESIGTDNVVMSIDLRGGRPLVGDVSHKATLTSTIVDRVLELGITQLLFLDLARVGTGAGIGTDDLARSTLEHPRKPKVFVGGGVSGPADIRQLANHGLHGVLLASTLHDGRITRQDLDSLRVD